MKSLEKLSGAVAEAWNGTRRSINASAKGIATSTETAVSKMGDGLDSVNKRFDKMSHRLNNWADGNRVGGRRDGEAGTRGGAAQGRPRWAMGSCEASKGRVSERRNPPCGFLVHCRPDQAAPPHAGWTVFSLQGAQREVHGGAPGRDNHLPHGGWRLLYGAFSEAVSGKCFGEMGACSGSPNSSAPGVQGLAAHRPPAAIECPPGLHPSLGSVKASWRASRQLPGTGILRNAPTSPPGT